MEAISRFLKENPGQTVEAAREKGYSVKQINDALSTLYQPLNNDTQISSVDDAKEFSNSLAPGSTSPSSKVTNTLAGLAESGVKGLTNTGNPMVDGVKNSLVSTFSNAMQGKDVDAADVAKDAARNTLVTGTMGALGNTLGAGTGVAGNLVGMGFDAMTGGDVDWGTGIAGSVGGLLGNLALGPIGGFIGGSLVGSSYKDGFIGDAFDSRNQEGYRDVVEDLGKSYGDSAKMANSHQSDIDKGYLTTNFDDFTSGRQDSLGDAGDIEASIDDDDDDQGGNGGYGR